MPASALSCSASTVTRLSSICRPASRRFTSTRSRFSSSAGAAPSRTRSPTRRRASRLIRSSSSVTSTLRRAASSSPALSRTSATSRRSRSATSARFISTLARRHAHPAVHAAVQIQRQGDPDAEVAVGTDGLLPAQLEHRVRAQPRLAQAAPGGVHLGARRAQVGVVGQSPRDDLVDRHDAGVAGLGERLGGARRGARSRPPR